MATFDYDIDQLARRLLADIRRGAPPVAMSSPPTISGQNTTPTITGGQIIAQDSPLITYLGTEAGNNGIGGLGTDWHAQHVDKNAMVAGYRMGCAWSPVIMTDAPAIEWAMFTNSAKFRVFIDEGNGEQAVSLTATALASGTTRYYGKVTFADARVRRVRLEFTPSCHFAGFRVAANYSLWKADIDTVRTMIVGESYVDGQYGDGSADWLLNFSNQLRYLLNFQDFFQSGSSGEGYLKTGTQSGRKLRDRVATDIVAYAPKHVAVALGINDGNPSLVNPGPGATLAESLQIEVTALYGQLLAALPGTIITVIGPWRTPGLNPSQTLLDAIKAGVQAQPEYAANNAGRITFIDTFAENWQQNGGRVGATSGTGNSNIYIGADNGHFVQAGHDYGARRVVNAVVTHLKALAA